MGSAEKCPVCNGSGQYRPPTRSTIQLPSQRQCHGCQGRGWVENVGEGLLAAMQEAVEALRQGKALVQSNRLSDAPHYAPHPAATQTRAEILRDLARPTVFTVPKEGGDCGG